MKLKEIAKQARKLAEPFCITKGKEFRLKDIDPNDTLWLKDEDKPKATEALSMGVDALSRYQEMLYADDKRSLLLIFQAMDAAGKDGAIKHVLSGVNPQGCDVHSFKAPTSEDLDHDYLWRSMKVLPNRGHIGIFNRSYYEEVLVVRVHPQLLLNQKLPAKLRKPDIWKRRFREINDWEHYLTDQGYKIVKLFLHLSNEEQRQRFLDRIDEPEKNWKFSGADAKERTYWDDYQKAFSEVLSNTSTEWAPWYVVPADDKPYARLVAAGALAHALIEIDPKYPTVSDEVRAGLGAARIELMAQAPEGASADRNVEADDDAEPKKAKGKKKGKRK